MTSNLELAADPPEIEQIESGKEESHESRIREFGTYIGLTLMSGSASYLELTGKMTGWNWAERGVGQSLRHPLIGYATASWATRKFTKHRLVTVVAAATTADWAIQAGEPVVLDPDHNPLKILSGDSIVETSKDYCFTILGMLGYLMQNRRR